MGGYEFSIEEAFERTKQRPRKEYAMPLRAVPGLKLRVRPSGALSYVLCYRIPGTHKFCRRFIANAHIVTPDVAIAEALRVYTAVQRGIAPTNIISANKHTVATAFEGYRAIYLLHTSREHAQAVERIFQSTLIPKLNKMPLADVRVVHISIIIQPSLQRAHYGTARNIFNAARAFLSWCKDRNYIDSNPLLGSSFHHLFEDSEHRYSRPLKPPDIVKLWNACAGLKAPWSSAIQLMITTGLRKSVVLNASWKDIDLNRRTWRVQSHRANDQTIDLNELTCDILRSLPRHDGQPLIFPSPHHKRAHQPIRGIAIQVHSLRAKSGVGNWRLDDLRRTVKYHIAHSRAGALHTNDLVLWGNLLKGWIETKPEEVVL